MTGSRSSTKPGRIRKAILPATSKFIAGKSKEKMADIKKIHSIWECCLFPNE